MSSNDTNKMEQLTDEKQNKTKSKNYYDKRIYFTLNDAFNEFLHFNKRKNGIGTNRRKCFLHWTRMYSSKCQSYSVWYEINYESMCKVYYNISIT